MDDSSAPPSPGFTAAPVSAHVTRIHDPRDVLMYLVTGKDRALLVDTGYGIGDLAAFVSSLTDLPLTAVLTHGHVDHAFGASWLADARIHPADLPVVAQHQAASRQLHAEVLAAHGAAPGGGHRPDRDSGAGPGGRGTGPAQHLAGGAPALAPEVDLARLTPLRGGERLELGTVTVEVLEAPGHTPGSLALLVEEDRILITGDAANQMTFLFLPESSTLTEYSAMLRRLRQQTQGRYDRVLISHGSGEITSTLLDDLLTLCERILARDDDAVPFRFEGMEGLVARAVARPEGEDGPLADDAPNIVYDPRRL